MKTLSKTLQRMPKKKGVLWAGEIADQAGISLVTLRLYRVEGVLLKGIHYNAEGGKNTTQPRIEYNRSLTLKQIGNIKRLQSQGYSLKQIAKQTKKEYENK